jgi:hypothetical protein
MGIVTSGATVRTNPISSTPTLRTVNWDLEKYRAALDIETDFDEDNLEGPTTGQNTILDGFMTQIVNDIELAAISSDAGLETGVSQTAENNLLGINDGFIKILNNTVPAGQRVDAGGAASSTRLFYEMKRRIPARYRALKPNYVWCVSPAVHDKYLLDLSTRGTDLGDLAITSSGVGGPIRGPWGIPMVEVHQMPEDLTVGTASTGTQIWLTTLSNLVVFIGRDITVERERKPRSDLWELTMHYRKDFNVINPDLVVQAYNVDIEGVDYTG